MPVQNYLDQIWDAFNEGICITNAHGIILHVNRKYEEITGFDRKNIIGLPAYDLVQSGKLDVILNPEVITRKERVTKIQSLADGRQLILEGNPVFDKNGNTVLCITFLRDDTIFSDMRNRISLQKELLETFQGLSTGSIGTTLTNPKKIAFSTVMQQLYTKIADMAETDATVLILGETGVGKDVIARRIHNKSLRTNKTFIKIDCGSIPENLIETELFGYVAGTFSGANKNGKIGLIEAANEGTLFFDEIGELPMLMQTRLLRFLQDGEIVRVGSTTPKKINVRIIAATNKNLEKSVALGEFRNDLYYRLKVAVINVPPLRERQADIVPLAENFLQFYGNKYHKRLEFSQEAKELLQQYSWPGNVRELENMIQGLIVTCKQKIIKSFDLPLPAHAIKSVQSQHGSQELPDFQNKTYKEIMKEYENKVLCAAVKRFDKNISKIAKALQIDRSTVFRKVKELEKAGLL